METIGLYLRLSKEDKTGEQSESIGNQKNLLLDYIAHHGECKQSKIKCYVDDGYSGLTLKRPGFQQMMQEMYQGKIAMILVKDLSRLSRNHLFLARFREQICPGLGVELVSLGEPYDSRKEQWGNLEIRFKSLFYEYYCSDISRKVKIALETKKNMGEYAVAAPPFGYIKEKGGNWRIDPVKAQWIRSLYDRTEKRVPVSQMVMRDQKQYDFKVYPMKIYRILHNPVYAGYHVWHKYETKLYIQEKNQTVPYGEWKIEKGQHEEIISLNQYNRVQKITKNEKKLLTSHEC